MATKYFAATTADGFTVLRSSASRTYAFAACLKRATQDYWCASWSSREDLAHKAVAGFYIRPGDKTEVALAREVSKAEYLKLKAEGEQA